MRRVAAMAVVAGLVVAGCSSSGSDDVTDTTEPTSSTASSGSTGTTGSTTGGTTGSADGPTAAELAELALTGPELGAGWTARTVTDDGSKAPGCLGELQDVGADRPVGQVEYTDPADDYAAELIEFAGDDAEDEFAKAEAILDGCDTVQLSDRSPTQGTVSKVDIPTVGDDSAFYEISASGSQGAVTLGTAIVVVDGHELTLLYGISAGPDRAGFQAFAEKAVDKVEAGASS